jgi:hypothetical protein
LTAAAAIKLLVVAALTAPVVQLICLLVLPGLDEGVTGLGNRNTEIAARESQAGCMEKCNLIHLVSSLQRIAS